MDISPELQEKRFSDMAQRSEKTGCFVFSAFLDLGQQNVLEQCRRRLAAGGITLFGGAQGCERKIVRFGSEDELGYDEPFPISCLCVRPVNARFAEKLSHRDVLGAVMSLGIERELTGDIIVREEEAYLFCLERIVPYLTEGIRQIRHTSVRCTEVETPPEGELYRLQRQNVLLQSVRLDAVLSHIYKLSRSEAQALFETGKVFVNGMLCGNTSHVPKEGDTVSVRGFGRMKFAGVDSVSKKGKYNTAVDVFI